MLKGRQGSHLLLFPQLLGFLDIPRKDSLLSVSLSQQLREATTNELVSWATDLQPGKRHSNVRTRMWAVAPEPNSTQLLWKTQVLWGEPLSVSLDPSSCFACVSKASLSFTERNVVYTDKSTYLNCVLNCFTRLSVVIYSHMSPWPSHRDIVVKGPLLCSFHDLFCMILQCMYVLCHPKPLLHYCFKLLFSKLQVDSYSLSDHSADYQFC